MCPQEYNRYEKQNSSTRCAASERMQGIPGEGRDGVRPDACGDVKQPTALYFTSHAFASSGPRVVVLSGGYTTRRDIGWGVGVHANA